MPAVGGNFSLRRIPERAGFLHLDRLRKCLQRCPQLIGSLPGRSRPDAVIGDGIPQLSEKMTASISPPPVPAGLPESAEADRLFSLFEVCLFSATPMPFPQ
jgi:hypothetical protein